MKVEYRVYKNKKYKKKVKKKKSGWHQVLSLRINYEHKNGKILLLFP